MPSTKTDLNRLSQDKLLDAMYADIQEGLVFVHIVFEDITYLVEATSIISKGDAIQINVFPCIPEDEYWQGDIDFPIDVTMTEQSTKQLNDEAKDGRLLVYVDDLMRTLNAISVEQKGEGILVVAEGFSRERTC